MRRAPRAVTTGERYLTDYIREVISRTHPFRDWLVLPEFPLNAGKRSIGTPRIDILAIKYRSGGGFGGPLTRIAYEIKVNRRDFFSELERPEKWRKAYEICDYFWFAVPEGLVTEDEIPPECGLMWVSRHSPAPTIVTIPPKRTTEPPSVALIMDLLRRTYQVGRRDGAGTCAFERFDMLQDLMYMFIQNNATPAERRRVVRSLSHVFVDMQRHVEAKELLRIADGYEPSESWFVPRDLQSGLNSAK